MEDFEPRERTATTDLLIPEREEDQPAPRAGFFQLFRYTTKWDKFMLILGSIVTIINGATLPLYGGVVGDVTQNFVNFNSRLAPLNDTDPEREKIFDEFHAAVTRSCLMYLSLGILAFVTGSIQEICFQLTGENMVNRLRKEFMKAILRQDIGWFDSQKSGALGTELFSNLQRVKEGVGSHIGYTIEYFSEFIGGFAICFFYDWRLTLMGMSLIPFIIALGIFDTKKMASVESEIEHEDAKAGAVAEQALTSIRTVMAFNGQQYECNKYNGILESVRRKGTRYACLHGMYMAISFILIFGSYCVSLYVGTELVYMDRIKGGVVVTVFITLMFSVGHADAIAPLLSSYGKAMGAAGILYKIIDRDPEIDAYSKEGERPIHVDGRICVRDLRFTYPCRPDVPVLKGISFDAEPGQTVALVGASGSGKSTIVQLLLRFYDPTQGRIVIDGIETDKWNIDYLRKTIGLVSQEPMLFNTTIEENIRYGRENISDSDIWAALKKANAFDFVKSFPDGLKTLVGDRGTQLSGGQKQRIAIARALVRDPKILLLDEATSALDADSESIVQSALENASKGRTTIVIAHRLSTIRNADKIIAMRHGEVVEQGTHEELMAKEGLYFELVSAQVFVDLEAEEKPAQRQYLQSRSISSEGGRIRGAGHDYDRMHSITSIGSHIDDDEDETLKRLKEELEEEGASSSSIWRILKEARSEWKFLFVALIFSFAEGGIYPTLSLLFTELVRIYSLEDKDAMRQAGHLVAFGFLGLGFCYALTQFTQLSLYGTAAERMIKRLRSKVFRNVMRQDAEYFDRPAHAPGKIVTRLATDANNIKPAINDRMGLIFAECCTDFIAICVSFYFGWQLALIVVPIFPIAALIHVTRANYLEKRWLKDEKHMETCGRIAMEAIENMRTVQALTLQGKLYGKFCKHLHRPMATNRQKAVLQGLSYGAATSIHYFLYAVCFRFGLYYIYHKIMDPQDVLRSLFAVSFTSGSIGVIAGYMPDYMVAKMAAGLLFKMVDQEPKIDGMSDEGRKPNISGNIKVNAVKFNYAERKDIRILDGLDLEISPGQTVALVGPSGCGKSTMVSLIERLYDPQEGTIEMDGCDLKEMNPRHLRAQMSLVAQEPILFDMSIKENILYGIEDGAVSEEEMWEAAKNANIHDFVVGLPEAYGTRVGDKGTQLSGGQKQRIAIARALVRDPKILLLDEATSALDTESEKQVQLALEKAATGRSCVIVAHRLSTIVNADVIVVFKDGKVAEKGTHEELIAKRGVYWSLTQKQNVR